MSKLRNMLSPDATETVYVRCIPIPFPVQLDLPEEVRDKLPLGTVKQISGQRVLRFYCPPTVGHTIEFKGHVWGVIGLHHPLQVKGSTNPDKLPLVLTEYVGSTNA